VDSAWEKIREALFPPEIPPSLSRATLTLLASAQTRFALEPQQPQEDCPLAEAARQELEEEVRLHEEQQDLEFHKKHYAKIRAGRLKSKKEAIARARDVEEMPTAISDHQRA
jgi:hypothetical protein